MIRPISEDDIPAITRIHIESLKNDFLPSLGYEFLKTIYQSTIGKNGVYGFVELEKSEIVGFVIGTDNMDTFFKNALKQKFFKLSFLLGLEILKKPKIVKNLIETFLYPSKDQGVKAELIVIAIKKKFQGLGLGKKLTQALETKFKKKKIFFYKLTVHANKKAVNFYEKLNFKKNGFFNLYGKPWYIYEKKIA